MRKAKRNYRPKWWRHFKRFLKSRRGKTEKGIHKLEGTLKNHGYKYKFSKWSHIKKKIKNGEARRHHKNSKKIVKAIKEDIPSLNHPLKNGKKFSKNKKS